MTRRTALLIYGLIILIFAIGIFWQWVGINYDNCLIKHRSGYFLLYDRAPIHEACRKNLNPFHT